MEQLPRAKILTVHPEHMRSLASMPPRYTVHPEHKNPCIGRGLGAYKMRLSISSKH
jgi:hypothetical protein